MCFAGTLLIGALILFQAIEGLGNKQVPGSAVTIK